MISPIDTALLLLMLSVLFAFGSSRILSMIKVIAVQGIVVSVVPVFLHNDFALGNILFGFVIALIRGIIIPVLLFIAIKKISVRREIEPLIGYHASIFIGLILIVFSIFISFKFNFPVTQSNPLILPAGITVLVGGMFLLMARRKAVTMLSGYLMLENGIYLIGSSLSKRTHHIVEFGILLDVLVGVMIMGIVLYNIQRTFDDIDTTLLRKLKD